MYALKDQRQTLCQWRFMLNKTKDESQIKPYKNLNGVKGSLTKVILKPFVMSDILD